MSLKNSVDVGGQNSHTGLRASIELPDSSSTIASGSEMGTIAQHRRRCRNASYWLASVRGCGRSIKSAAALALALNLNLGVLVDEDADGG